MKQIQLVEDAIPAISIDEFTATPIGLAPTTTTVSYDVWDAYGEGLHKVEGAIQWVVGDWLNYGESRYGETYSQAMSHWPDAKYQSLADYSWVARKVEFSLRNENLSWTHHRHVAKLDPDKQEYWLNRAEKESWSERDLANGILSGLYRPGSDVEFWTPAKYVDSARSVMGEFDLDPASALRANDTVQAKTFYTKEDNGLEQPWEGRVWLNPPYAGLAGPFLEKLMTERQTGNVTEAIILLPLRCADSNWFTPVWDLTICITDHRIAFMRPDGISKSGNITGSVFAYFGPNRSEFIREFKKFGVVVEKVLSQPGGGLSSA